ncbi:hypothetical protein IX51_04515 [uncultured archaeon]|nr:hypothetical protein IX51_04515 [uncultured archaeon]
MGGKEIPSTKTGIVHFLKRNSEATLEEIGKEFDISKVAALKHLGNLEKDELVRRRYIPSGRGRPKCYFSLSEKGNNSFQKGYEDIVTDTMDYVDNIFGREYVGNILHLRTEKKLPEYRETLRKYSERDKIKKLTSLRDHEGYMSEWRQLDESTFEITEYNCPILAISQKYGEACKAENELFTNVLEADVESTHRVVAGSRACRFVVRFPRR